MSRRGGTYQCSDGSRISQSMLESRIRKTKDDFKLIVEQREEGYACDSLPGELACDRSHIISVDRCKKIGKAELAYDINNLVAHSARAHNIWANGPISEKKKFKNFDKMLEYIEKNDPEQYRRIESALNGPTLIYKNKVA